MPVVQPERLVKLQQQGEDIRNVGSTIRAPVEIYLVAVNDARAEFD
jgi:hypothetical protein